MELQNSSKAIFEQIAEWVENEILKGNLKDGDKVLSQVEFAKAFNINPITAAKGVALLETRGIVIKKRGLGMFVAQNAKEKIAEYRKNSGLTAIIKDLVSEARILNIDFNTLTAIIKKEMEEGHND